MRSEIDTIAAKLGATEEARRKWRARGAVPHRWRFPILTEADKQGVGIAYTDMTWRRAKAKRKPAPPRRRRSSAPLAAEVR